MNREEHTPHLSEEAISREAIYAEKKPPISEAKKAGAE